MFPIAKLPLTIRALLVSFLWKPETLPDLAAPNRSLTFHLRHQHAVSNTSRTIFTDVHPTSYKNDEIYTVQTTSISTHKPRSNKDYAEARVRSMRFGRTEDISPIWDMSDTEGPDVEKRETLLTLAKMTFNSYLEPTDKEWYDLGSDWNASYPFGWEPDTDGFRGHVFVSEDNNTVVVSVKGTSAGWIVGGGGPTVKKDKIIDNLLFSCCCAKVGPTWSTVCDCHAGGYKCDQTCLENSLIDDDLYYSIGVNLYTNLTYMYPTANIWFIGHSLGGALVSLLGVTFGVPVVAFEAPGERMAAQRLHLALPPSTQHITHVYNTADSIAMGICNGVSSACALGGYAMESRCHLGVGILYDTVTKLGWSVGIAKHSIKAVIDGVLAKDDTDWEGDGVGKVPKARPQDDCVDCYSWEFGEFKNTTRRVHGYN